MKLSVDLLDNEVKSAVVDIGANNGYVEVFVSGGVVHLNVFNKHGDVVHDFGVTIADLKKKLGRHSTTPKFEPAQEHYED